MGPYLGDYEEDEIIYFCWDTNDKVGASITRSTNGSIGIYRDDSTVFKQTGITDTEDFDGLTGIHNCKIDLSSSSYYEKGHDYSVVLSGAVIDSEQVNAVLATFSIENRYVGSVGGSSSENVEKAARVLINKAVQDKMTGAISYYDDDGETVILTHTPTDSESSITRTPS